MIGSIASTQQAAAPCRSVLASEKYCLMTSTTVYIFGFCMIYMGYRKSFHAPTPFIMMTVTVTGLSCGRMICRKHCRRFAPSMVAASSSARGIAVI